MNKADVHSKTIGGKRERLIRIEKTLGTYYTGWVKRGEGFVPHLFLK